MKGSRSLVLGLGILFAAAAGVQTQSLEDYDYENLTFRGLGVDVGYVFPNKVKGAPALGIRADLGYLGPGVRIAPSLTFWNSEMRAAELDRLAGQLNRIPPLRERGVSITGRDLGTVELSAIGLNLDGQYVWLAPTRLLAYLGAGAGVYVLNGRGQVIEGTFVEDLLDSVTPSLTGLAGLEYALFDRFRLYGEARYTFMSDVRFGTLRIGGAVMLPQYGDVARMGRRDGDAGRQGRLAR